MTTVLKTTALGEIRGKTGDGVVQYLGIKYATLRNRLAEAELVERRDDGEVLDATKDGPATPSITIGCDLEQGAIQHTLPKKDIPQSDLDCLNLNITVPKGTTPASKLPVFLFIHGGGFVLGANSWPQFDYARLVKLSQEKGYPIVAVSINYRLGVFGFLTSEELRNAGYKANNGFRDQKVAILWVRKHIQDFGGDPENITLAGMSAGGASVVQHIHSEQPLFKRAIAMSGTNLLMIPFPLSVHEQGYEDAMKAWGLADATPEERIKALLERPAQDLISKLPPTVSIGFAVDGDLIPTMPTFEEIGDKGKSYPKGKTWCKELLIGNAQIDISVFAYLNPQLKNNAARRFIDAVNQALPDHPTEVRELLQKYGIAEGASDEEAFTGVLDFLNDVVFFAPVLTYVKGWPGNAYVYYFNEENPWDGPWKGRSSHILDLAYLFQNYNEFLTPDQQAVATAFAEDFFKFCHGVAPWSPVQGGDIESGFTARVYGPSREKRVTSVVSQPYGGETQRRRTLFDYVDKVPLDNLSKVFGIFKSSS
ncbi:hypothetical protein VTN96DRAFT_2252 [Rasamsonia emersonii]|uniref:Carboxylic ester hydrolase n=1 Tax=Rasamsonia emersonii (strain ATCC 16479 / CBS 393.64 / IMI 116815) TaxID=1408163 RepID=A0A0F4Z2Y5_RASE3|nr:Carboxylesterase [Rasamsonia emersonii CBS 393.64]KKA24700.1 Carboxylesterase [Rasamsonia emersonii CBS 393.64]